MTVRKEGSIARTPVEKFALPAMIHGNADFPTADMLRVAEVRQMFGSHFLFRLGDTPAINASPILSAYRAQLRAARLWLNL
jgi:hypothetical protein